MRVCADHQWLDELFLEKHAGMDRAHAGDAAVHDLSIVDGGIARDAHGGLSSCVGASAREVLEISDSL
jgi:hypothetical protein